MKSSAIASPPENRVIRWQHYEAVIMGSIGVLFFSFTLPATHIAVASFGGLVVGLGRAIIAGTLAAVVLLLRREPLPPRHTWVSLVFVAAGVVIGFPLFSAFALEGAAIAHSAVINGLLPAATAIVAVILVKERTSVLFWINGSAIP